MNNIYKFGFLILLSPISVFGASEFCPLDKQGKIIPAQGYEFSSIKQQDKKEIYTLTPNQENPYGGPDQIWIISKDKSGRVTRIETGGERPSQKLIDFENKQTQNTLLQNALARKKIKSSFSLPNAEAFKLALASPEDIPVRFGSVVELDHSSGNCYVSKLAHREYDQKTKRVIESVQFSVDRCEAIKNLNQKFQKDIAECSAKYKVHEVELTSLLTKPEFIGNLTSGVGGGGGAPMRSIASVSDFDGPGHFGNLLGKYKSSLETEKELCDILRPSEVKGLKVREQGRSKSSSNQ